MFLRWRRLKERPWWSGGQRCLAAFKALAKKGSMKPQAWFIWFAKVRTHQNGAVCWPLRLRLTEDLALCGLLSSHGGRNSNSLPGHILQNDYVGIGVVGWVNPSKERPTANTQRAMQCENQSFKLSLIPLYTSHLPTERCLFLRNPVNNMGTSGVKATVKLHCTWHPLCQQSTAQLLDSWLRPMSNLNCLLLSCNFLCRRQKPSAQTDEQAAKRSKLSQRTVWLIGPWSTKAHNIYIRKISHQTLNTVSGLLPMKYESFLSP